MRQPSKLPLRESQQQRPGGRVLARLAPPHLLSRWSHVLTLAVTAGTLCIIIGLSGCAATSTSQANQSPGAPTEAGVTQTTTATLPSAAPARPTSTATSIPPTPTASPLPPTPTATPARPTPTATPRPAQANTNPPTPTRAAAPAPTRAPAPTPTQAPAQTTGVNGNPWGYNFTSGTYITDPPSTFCNYFACIASFWKNTKGYVMECKDGKFSHSGGRRGSCSDHKGDWRPLLKP